MPLFSISRTRFGFISKPTNPPIGIYLESTAVRIIHYAVLCLHFVIA
jgi:hypothetical protein